MLSWLKGANSTGAGSLRIAPLVPGAATLLMLLKISRRPPIRRPPFAPGNG